MLFSSWWQINSYLKILDYFTYSVLKFSSHIILKLDVAFMAIGQMVLFYIKETISKAAYQHLYVSEIEIVLKFLRQHYYYNLVVCFWVENHHIKVFQNNNWSRLRFCIHPGNNWNVLRWYYGGGGGAGGGDVLGHERCPSVPYNCLHSILGTTVQTDLSLTTGLYDAGVAIPCRLLDNMHLLSHLPQHKQFSGKSRYCWWRFSQVIKPVHCEYMKNIQELRYCGAIRWKFYQKSIFFKILSIIFIFPKSMKFNLV